MATINYWGLTGVKGDITGVTLTTTTIDQLITSIAADEGLSTEYYHISLNTDPSKNDISYGDSSTKLSAIGFTDGCTVYCTPNQNGNREYRQIQKLDIAQRKRLGGLAGDSTQGVYYRILNTYNRDLLPTKYSVNTLVDNANTGGLYAGRPWITPESNPAPPPPAWTLPAGMDLHEPLEGSGGTNNTVPGTTYLTAATSGINAAYGTRGTPYDPGGNIASVPNSASGIYREKYIGNLWSTYGAFSEFDLTWFDDPTRGPIGVDIYSYAGFGQRKDLTAENGYSLQWRGYVQAPATGTYNWWTSGTDDDAAIWIGTAALTPTYANMNGYATNNRVLSLNSVNLTAGQWYPVRMVFTEFNGWEQCQWFLQNSTAGVLYGGLDLTWAYNSATNGF